VSRLGGPALVAFAVAAALVASGCRTVAALRQRCVAGDLAACESACKKGVPGEGGCFHAAEQHRQRAALDFRSSEWKKSTELYRQSCDGGYADGCLFSAQAVEAPYGAIDPSAGGAELPKMIGDAEVLAREQRLVKACSLGSIAGCKRLGDVLIGKASDRARAAYGKACRGGPAAQVIAASEQGGLLDCEAARDHEVEIAERFRVECTHGQADACTDLGNLLHAVDPPRALRLFASECELRGVAQLTGGFGPFIRMRDREARNGVALPSEKAPAPLPAGVLPVAARVVGVTGEVALVEVERALSRHRDDLATCMATLPKEKAVELAVELIVDRTGDVWHATLKNGALSAAGSNCVTTVLEALSFTSPHDGIATVEVILDRAAAVVSSAAVVVPVPSRRP
jgi:hypothetical protein